LSQSMSAKYGCFLSTSGSTRRFATSLSRRPWIRSAAAGLGSYVERAAHVGRSISSLTWSGGWEESELYPLLDGFDVNGIVEDLAIPAITRSSPLSTPVVHVKAQWRLDRA
jgi:hypothetical protein